MTLDDDIDRIARPLLPAGAELHPDQRRAIRSVAERDTLVVLPTGSGKTLVYQVAARLLGGVTLVISPTLSLQADQLAGLRECGFRAAAVNGNLRLDGRRQVLDDAASGRLDVVLLTPEQATNDDVLDPLLRADVRLFAVDEAHCVATWGVDFRPHYLALDGVIERLGRPRVLGLTATAPPRTRRAVAEALGTPGMAMVVGNADRPEIHLSARVTADEDATEKALLELVDAHDTDAGAMLVYAATRRRVDELHERMTAAGYEVDRYHGGMRPAERGDVLRRFRDGGARLVLATSAFGLGIDRADVRQVVHVDPPESVDELWQEIGRAGRDGEPASAVLITRPGGYGLRRYFASVAGASDGDVYAVVVTLRDLRGAQRPAAIAAAADLSTRRCRAALNLLERAGAVLEDRAGVRLSTRAHTETILDRVDAMRESLRTMQESEVDLVQRYAETDDCRRRLVLELLGEAHPDPCGRCDSCDAGTSTSASRRPFPLGAEVRHASFGNGRIAQYDGDRVVVLFEQEGYRTLDLDLVESDGLLVAR
ncbi:RecQ family ATP-dependent DNA helicase [Aeromicrobium wangtongii]|uniref:RecQ family ATP-dependent DNA helicase n=1 Tax=Aeromicrobium wangtongii TaxID=2969247 RepID=UPI002017630D|nr:RecQ family ATP-dependent DNA helicase [Aeromicrobium wangtongii]MCL3818259.1 RecQ family ATP-dependent DNA helicase [Aeromicrobium wangtongii]